MIWLSAMHGQSDVSYYFSPQSFELSCSEGVSQGIIKGVFGDGAEEVLTEISLGAQEYVKFLPLWSEFDGIASFPQSGEERILGSLLLDEIKQRIDIDNILASGQQCKEKLSVAPQEPTPAWAMAA